MAAPLLLTGTGRLQPAPPAEPIPPGHAWAILVRAGRIASIGSLRDAAADAPDAERVDLGSSLVTPGLVDSHTHPVFAGDRADEAAARLDGQGYDGGGILRTVRATRAAEDATLERLVEERLHAALAAGTTTVECKSGYGLSIEEELRHLRILRRVAERVPVRVVTTFLGAHAVPPEAAGMREYAEHVAAEMIPAVAREGLAEFVDAFVEEGFFDADAARRIARAAREHRLGMRLHADQLTRTGGAELGVQLDAASVDHLEQLDDPGVRALAKSGTVATLVPAPALVLRDRMPPARQLLEARATVALASDANAGTFGGWAAMPLVVGLAATALRMTVTEALTAATTGGARALRRTDEIGSLRPGARADLVAWDAEHEGAFALSLGAVRPLRVWVGGRELELPPAAPRRGIGRRD